MIKTKFSLAFLSVVSLIFATFSVFTVWLMTSRYGCGFVTAMSDGYIHRAEDFIQSGFINSLVYYNDATWSPLYPMVLAAFSLLFNVDILAASRYLSLFFAAMISGCSVFVITKISKKSLFLISVFALTFNLNPFVAEILCCILSEALFIFFVMLLFEASDDEMSVNRLFLMSLFSALAILTRYSGVAIVPAVCLWILFHPGQKIREKIKKCFFYATFPTVVYILYIVRNYIFTGSMMGPRDRSTTGFFANAFSCLKSMASLFVPYAVEKYFGDSYRVVLYVLVVAATIIVAILLYNWREILRTCRLYWGQSRAFSLSVIIIMVYSGFLIITTTITALDAIATRFVLPIYIFILVLYVVICDVILRLWARKRLSVCLFFICVITSFSLFTYEFWVRASSAINQGYGFTSESYFDSDWSLFFKAYRENHEGTVFANDCGYFELVSVSVRDIPRKYWFRSSTPTGITRENFAEKVPDFNDSILVLVDRPYLTSAEYIREYFTLSELQEICDMELLFESKKDKSVIYRVGKCGEFRGKQ